MKTKKNESHSSKKQSVVSQPEAVKTASGLGKADPIPTVIAPTPPPDYVASVVRGAARPSAQVLAACPAVIKEVTEPSYEDDFGANAPRPAALGESLRFAVQWSTQLEAAETWLGYVLEQTRYAWQQASPQLDALGRTFAYARSCDPAIPTKYPGIAKLFEARAAPARIRAALRRAKARVTQPAVPDLPVTKQ